MSIFVRDPEKGQGSVNVGYGPTFLRVAIAAGDTIRKFRKDTMLQAQIGFVGTEPAVVNGREAGDNTVLRDGDEVEFVRQAGEKA